MRLPFFFGVGFLVPGLHDIFGWKKPGFKKLEKGEKAMKK
jgi:hypothetical protein